MSESLPMPSQYAIGSDSLPGLSKLIEEMGEVQQQIGRLMQTRFLGQRLHWDGSDPYEQLILELADLQAAIHFVVYEGMVKIDLDSYHERVQKKYSLFSGWQKEQTQPIDEILGSWGKSPSTR